MRHLSSVILTCNSQRRATYNNSTIYFRSIHSVFCAFSLRERYITLELKRNKNNSSSIVKNRNQVKWQVLVGFNGAFFLICSLLLYLSSLCSVILSLILFENHWLWSTSRIVLIRSVTFQSYTCKRYRMHSVVCVVLSKASFACAWLGEPAKLPEILNEDLVQSADCTRLYIRLSRCIVKFRCAWGQDIVKGFSWISVDFDHKINFDSTENNFSDIRIFWRVNMCAKLQLKLWNTIRRGAILSFFLCSAIPLQREVSRAKYCTRHRMQFAILYSWIGFPLRFKCIEFPMRAREFVFPPGRDGCARDDSTINHYRRRRCWR